MTHNEFNDIIKYTPYVTAEGINIMRFNPADFAAARQHAYKLFDEANICEQWLALTPKTKTIKKKIGSSFDLSVKFGQWYREDTGRTIIIPEGALLIAALHLDIDCKRIKWTTSFYMNISNRRKIGGRWLNDQRLSTAVNFY
jgi:hypothetical protein